MFNLSSCNRVNQELGLKRTYNDIMDQNEASDNETLPNLDSVDSSVDVDRVRAEYGKHSHVNVIYKP